jgi:hypothetical protein
MRHAVIIYIYTKSRESLTKADIWPQRAYTYLTKDVGLKTLLTYDFLFDIPMVSQLTPSFIIKLQREQTHALAGIVSQLSNY